MEKEDIAMVAQDIILNFPKPVDKPVVLFLPKRRFSRYLDMMKMEKHVDKTPCFTAEMKGGNVIYFCQEVVNNFVKNFSREMKKKFIEALTLHELLHIWNRLHVHTADEAVFSEKLVHKEMKNFYPSHFRVLEVVEHN